MTPLASGFWHRLKANRFASLFVILATLTLGILIGDISTLVNGNELIRVNSVEEYLLEVDQAFRRLCTESQQCELWFRGQPQAVFPLEPRIARKPLNPELEIIYLSKFKAMAIPYVQNLPSFPIPDGRAAYWHWLIMMQHYGVPTRLMDWSRDALTALFFATDQLEADKGKDAAVWVLNPVTLNRAFSFHSFVKPGYIPNLDEEVVNLLFGPNAQILESKKPAAVIGPLNNPHIVAQRGVFTVFPKAKEITALNLFPDSQNYLVKIVIAKDRIDQIKAQLTHYGITRISLFPEITEIANEIRTQVLQEGQLPSTTTSIGDTVIPQEQFALPTAGNSDRIFAIDQWVADTIYLFGELLENLIRRGRNNAG